MGQRTAKEAMRFIKDEDDPEMKPLPSNMDVGPLDPEQFLKTVGTKRRKSLGLPMKHPVPQAGQIVHVPSWKMSLVKEQSDLPKRWRRDAMKMFATGSTEVEIMAAFGIAKKTWNEWLTKDTDFAEFVSVGMTRAQAWWESQAKEYVNQSSARFNAALWFMNMKNRFGYKDTQDVNVKEQKLIGFTLLPPMVEDPRSPNATDRTE